ncbi:MAG: hypothetical protein ABIM50_10670 [Novosphingobium sp.]
MTTRLDRLRKGERWWLAEAAFRVCGLILLYACYHAALLAYQLVFALPAHQATPGEFAICAATYLMLTSGLALTFAGPGLLRHVPIPPHSAYFPGH